jgi:hypothetical protein
MVVEMVALVVNKSVVTDLVLVAAQVVTQAMVAPELIIISVHHQVRQQVQDPVAVEVAAALHTVIITAMVTSRPAAQVAVVLVH